MYERQIKPSTCTHFPVGSKVKITSSGKCYSTYKDMAVYMGVGVVYENGKNPFANGDIGVVVAKATHESSHYGEVLAVRVADGRIGLIGANGVATHEELKIIDIKDMVVGQVVRFTSLGHGHSHWKFELNKDYVVTKEQRSYNVGPANAEGNVPSRNWAGWRFVLVKDVPVVEVPVIGKPKLKGYELAPLTPENTTLPKFFDRAPSWATHVGSDSQGIHYFDHHPHVYNSQVVNSVSFLKGLLPHTHRHTASVGDHGLRTDTLQVRVIVRTPEVVEPTVAELVLEVAALRAKLWEAQQKLKKINKLSE